MDEFDRITDELLAQKDRIISQQHRDLLTLIKALAVHEGYDPDATAYRHLGHHLEDL